MREVGDTRSSDEGADAMSSPAILVPAPELASTRGNGGGDEASAVL